MLAVNPLPQEFAVYATEHPGAAAAVPMDTSDIPAPATATAAVAASTRCGRKCFTPCLNLFIRFS
ncbi:hypothetical protein Kisp01_66910 [Kineosporia sp. NBRC 101677]|nr:hypothetical protein Kisp01_66910 [Kineosporia sp. NBRC 101677]